MFKNSVSFFLSFFVVSIVSAQSDADSAAHQKNLMLLQTPQLHFATSLPVLPQNFATKNLPFFCDKEYKLEKITKIPFRFRLGSVEYCDKMEGKNK